MRSGAGRPPATSRLDLLPFAEWWRDREPVHRVRRAPATDGAPVRQVDVHELRYVGAGRGDRLLLDAGGVKDDRDDGDEDRHPDEPRVMGDRADCDEADVDGGQREHLHDDGSHRRRVTTLACSRPRSYDSSRSMSSYEVVHERRNSRAPRM